MPTSMPFTEPSLDVSVPASGSRWLPDYRTIWRWHFYAGLLTLPFVTILSVSGGIYLFKPQIEAWNDREYDSLVINNPAPVADQVKAALNAFPGSVPNGYELPRTATSAARVLIRKMPERKETDSKETDSKSTNSKASENKDTDGKPSVRSESETLRVYVHPEKLTVLGSVKENERLMKQMFRLHGELWMGDRGSNLVELASSWTIIMIVTGLYLWWPRKLRLFGGIWFPRFGGGSRIFWRDLHSVTGVWISVFVLFLLVTGLPWAKFWGNYLKTIRNITGTAVAQQDWTTGSERSLGGEGSSGGSEKGRSARDSGERSSGEHSDHGGGGGGGGRWRRGGGGSMPKDMEGFNRVYQTVQPLGLEHPVVIAPPSRGSENWTAKSTTQNRPNRVELELNGSTGEIVGRKDFKDRHWVDQVVGTCIAAHEGQLFGWPNQLLGLLTAMGLILVSVSGAIMWWRRRHKGVLGAPPIHPNPRISILLCLFAVMFGIYLPLFGASLLLVLVIERLILRRIPGLREWLGLHHQKTRAAA